MGDPPSSCLIQLTLKLLPLLWKRASSLGLLGSPARENTRKYGWLETRQSLLRCGCGCGCVWLWVGVRVWALSSLQAGFC